MKENLVHAKTCVYNINYHVVWSVKYRRKVISKEMEQFIQQTAKEIAEDKGFVVHLFVSAPPKLSIFYIVKVLKGVIARRVFMQFPDVRKVLRKGVLWNHSYYVETVGCVSESTIRRYIEKQQNAY